MTNGLASPLCRGAPGGTELSGSSRRNCETSGFTASAAPTGDFGIDVHIDTGVLGLSSGGLLSAIQELFVTPLWTALVWVVHALVVLLEWCFTIDLLDSPTVGVGLAHSLRQAQATFTEPWLATSMAVGAVLAAYNGLVRRRVAQTLGQALLVFAMMAGGIWVTLDPVGTVGALGGWVNQAGIGTLAVSARGTPDRAGGTLADAMGGVFSAAIEVPWCYLEFGDVGWCRNRERLDPRLHAAAQAIAAGEMVFARCEHAAAAFKVCSAPGSPQAKALESSARLLRAARSNGEIFLALPANGAQRNAIGDHESLLWAICQSDSATVCRGSASAEAEFRTDRGTWPRVAGLILIIGGALGMLLLLGYLALRLLAAALMSLLYLMLAPAAVLAPALGDGGRAVFRSWATQLVGAIASKLLFSFLLGAILAVLGMLENLEALGWWTQWLLMSAFWWGAFTHRHQMLRVIRTPIAGAPTDERKPITRRFGAALETPRRLLGDVRAAKRHREQQIVNRQLQRELRRTADASAPAAAHAAGGRAAGLLGRGQGPSDEAVGDATAGADAGADEQAARMLAVDRDQARAFVEREPEERDQLSAMENQLARVRLHGANALATQDGRRAARLAHRAARIEGEAERHRNGLTAARAAAQASAQGHDPRFGVEQLRDRQAFLDAQAALVPFGREGGARGSVVSQRDYPSLAGLVGISPGEYDGLHAREKRAARLEIDRELGARSVGRRAWGDDTQRFARDMPAAAARMQTRRRYGTTAPRNAGVESESSVMADVREVAARRKRQLGRGRP
ncbi:MAG TPA: hypothetical protein VHT25_06070 [Solirubrobacteraceae bacterium]|nr:hypothetical protein [Solirubrobacteraceae bacterium]